MNEKKRVTLLKMKGWTWSQRTIYLLLKVGELTGEPVQTQSQIIEKLGARQATVSDAMNGLLEMGVIEKLQGRGQRYTLRLEHNSKT
jgi:DNA-binding MarR family transcriptional regulator